MRRCDSLCCGELLGEDEAVWDGGLAYHPGCGEPIDDENTEEAAA